MSTTKRTGTIEWHNDHWDVRPTLANGKRGKRVHQPVGTTEARARDKAQALTDAAAARGTVEEVQELPEIVAPVDGPILEDWTSAWCDDRERRGLTSVDDDRGRLRKWVLPRLSPPLGERPFRAIQNSDIRALVEDLDARVIAEELHWKTAKNCWGNITKMCKDAVNSKTAALRVLDVNPCLGVVGPDEGVVKAKAYLYPSEFLAMMVCKRIPIRWRRLFAAAIYTYTRAGEFEALALGDVDLEHLRIHVHRAIDRNDGEEKETKTNVPRHVPMEPNAVPLLRYLVSAREAEPRLFAMPPLCDLSDRLRTYLKCAGVTRASLFANDATRKQITFHDLRATGITWMAIRGDDAMRIMHRAGHVNMSTTMAYVREAESLDFLAGDVFPELPAEIVLPSALPEGPKLWGSMRNDKGKECPQRDLNPLQGTTSGRDRDNYEPPVQRQRGPKRAAKRPKGHSWAALGQQESTAAPSTPALREADRRAREDQLADLIREGVGMVALSDGAPDAGLERAMDELLGNAVALLPAGAPR